MPKNPTLSQNTSDGSNSQGLGQTKKLNFKAGIFVPSNLITVIPLYKLMILRDYLTDLRPAL